MAKKTKKLLELWDSRKEATHINYLEQSNYENIQKAVYSGAGVYNIPIIRPTE